MALKDNWIDRQNGVDDVDSKDINKVARAVIELEENANKNVVDQTYSSTSENAQSGKAVAEALYKATNSLQAVNISFDKSNSGLESKNVQDAIDEVVTKIGGVAKVESWADVQNIVRLGLAPQVFKIGEQLVCNHETLGELTWDIIGFDHDVPADAQFKHSMTIQLHDVLPADMQFDGTEALFYCETELAAGTYHFTLLAGYDTAYGGGKSYQFTLTKAVPAGGVIMFPWGYRKQASTVLVSTYESRTATTAIESVAVTEGTGGTALDTLGECNHTHRIRYGSNNWKQSAMRQFLNSKGAAGAFWTPQTNFDRPPTWNGSTAGFLSDLDEDFLEVVGEVTKRTVLNTVCDGGGYEDLTEKFFLISRSEAYARNENGIEEGTPYEYYSLGSDLSAAGIGDDSNRIKYRGGSATHWWLRSPSSSIGYDVKRFNPSGAMSSHNVNGSNGVAPACNII